METRHSFGRWLMERRQQLDITRDELADRVGCAPITIAKIERDERRPSRQMAELLADVLLPVGDDRGRFIQWARGVPLHQANVLPEITVPVAAPGPSEPGPYYAEPPALDPGDYHCNNLPFTLTSLVGREDDVRRASGLLARDEVRLLTLTGPPGIGKTRLCIAVASLLLDEFASGVCWVPLATITDPALVAATIVQALGLGDVARLDPGGSLHAFLRGKQILLALDNFEQVMEASPLVSSLLASSPRLKVLVTSRERLRLYGEQEYPVQPLEVPGTPPRTNGSIDLAPHARSNGGSHSASLLKIPSIVLFVQRAQAVQPSFALTDENAGAVAEICRRLDGLPLAIELAAARVRFMPPQTLLSRLDNRLGLLTGGARDLPARQQTLRSAIAWSYDLLNEREKALFAAMGVFVGGCTLEALEYVASAGGEAALDELASLMDKSLVTQDDMETQAGSADLPAATATGEGRYSMLEMIREYALERLSASGREAQVRARHLAYYIQLAEQADRHYNTADGDVWLRRIGIERDNLRSALRTALDTGEREGALRLVAALWTYWYVTVNVSEGLQWLHEVLALSDGMPKPLVAEANMAAGAMEIVQDEYLRAKPYLERALRLFTEVGDRRNAARCKNALALSYLQLGDLSHASALFEESIKLHEEEKDVTRLALAYSNLSYALMQQRRYDEAKVYSDKAIALRMERGDKWGMASSLLILGGIAMHQGEYDEAVELLERSLAVAREVRERRDGATALMALGLCMLNCGRYDEAERYYRESLAVYRELGNSFGIARTLVGLAALAGAAGDFRRSVRLCGATLKFYEPLLTRLLPIELDLYNRVLDEARHHLGDAVVNATMYEGSLVPIERAIAEA